MPKLSQSRTRKKNFKNFHLNLNLKKRLSTFFLKSDYLNRKKPGYTKLRQRIFKNKQNDLVSLLNDNEISYSYETSFISSNERTVSNSPTIEIDFLKDTNESDEFNTKAMANSMSNNHWPKEILKFNKSNLNQKNLKFADKNKIKSLIGKSNEF